MLDAYIIDRIRQEQEENRRQTQIPLQIERPPPDPPRRDDERDERDERGTTVIDFRL